MSKKIGIVSLSSGILGEKDIKHEVEIGLQRLLEANLTVKFMPYSLKGINYLKKHPEKRAQDLLLAFKDPEIDIILCAIGGDDTYRLLPYLFEHNELQEVVTNKIFLGFSDTTINHFMLHKVGINSFYGQSFIADVCEIGPEMLSYSHKYFRELITTGSINEIKPSQVWFEERKSFAIEQIGTKLLEHVNEGLKLLQGPSVFSGKILGGCIDSLYDMFDGQRYKDMPALCRKYHLFPDLDDWKGRILLLETSEEKMSPDKYRKALNYLKETGLFKVISGIIVGKPIDAI